MGPSHEPTKPLQTSILDDAEHHSVSLLRWTDLSLYILSFVFLTTVVVGFVWHDLREVHRDTLAYWDVRLSSSADERVSFANLWLNERRTDTEAIADNVLSARLLSTAANRSNITATRQQADLAIERMARINGFVGGAVADLECHIAAQVNVPEEAMAGVQETCRRAERAGDFRVFVSGVQSAHVWLCLAYPVFAVGKASSSGQASRRELGVAVMIAEPWKPVFPFLLAESKSKGTTETLIAWEDAKETIVFFPSLAIKGVESVFRPLSQSTFESRVAREGNVGFGEFTDYRGVRVFGAARSIGSTGASLVRKVSRGEALSEFNKRAVFESLAGALSILLFGSVIAALHRRTAERDLREKLRQQEVLLDLKRQREVSEERFRVLLESVEAIVWEVDGRTLRLTFVSRGVEKALGYSTDQWLRTPDFWRDHLHPEDRERALAAQRAVQERCASQVVEYRMAAADGRLLWFRDYMHANPDPQGKAAQLRGIMVDITESKHAEEQLRKLSRAVEQSPASVVITDPQGNIEYVNPKFTAITGYTLEEAQGKNPSILRSYLTPAATYRELWDTVLSGREWRGEFANNKRNGELYWESAFISPIKDATGTITHLVAVKEDITARKQAQEELQRSLDQLHALAGRLERVREEERKRVAREVHDQLGQTLTALKLDLGSLLQEIPGAAKRPSKRALSILELVDETIKTVRRISTELRPGILDDLGLVATVEWAAGDFEARTGAKCRLDLPHEDIALDSERATAIFRILQETLTNVTRHAEASEVKVRLAREDGELILDVHDNGRGIDGDKISSADSLGILGMRERAHLLGGELTISGVPQKGTTVRVRIPEGSSAGQG